MFLPPLLLDSNAPEVLISRGRDYTSASEIFSHGVCLAEACCLGYSDRYPLGANFKVGNNIEIGQMSSIHPVTV